MSHWSDCNCIECLSQREGYGQPAPAPLPGVYLPPPMPGGLDPAPYLNPAPLPGFIDPLASLNEGRSAYQNLTAKHSILRTTVMTPHFPTSQELELWYSQYAPDFAKLCEIALPVSVTEITDMIDWLHAVESPRTFSPGEMVVLIEKLVLGQDVAFPEVELPARVIRFLKSVLRITVTGNQEKFLETDRARIRTLEYPAIQKVMEAQAAYDLAQTETFTSDWQTRVTVAGSTLNQARANLQVFKDEIASLNDQLFALQQVTLTDEELAQYLLRNLPDSAEKRELQNSHDRIQYLTIRSKELIDPLDETIAFTLSMRDPAWTRLQAAMANLIQTRSPVLYAYNTYQTPTPSQLQAYQLAQDDLTAAQLNIKPYDDRVSALQAQIQVVIHEHPECFPQGKPITDPSFITEMVNTAISQVALKTPSDLMSLTEGAMAIQASAVDARTAALQQERQSSIEARQAEFQAYFRAQVEAKLQFYQDQLKNAQDGYNELSAELNALATRVQTLQDQVSANIEKLGSVIGWWSHQNNIEPEVMGQPYFIGLALTNIVGLQGKLDTVDIPLGLPGLSSHQVFWGGPGASSECAGDTITLMGEMNTASMNYEIAAPGYLSKLEQLKAWMTQTKEAYQVTSDLMNSAPYMQQAIKDFSATPEGILLQSDIDSVVTPLREIALQVETNQQTLSGLLDDIEVQVLKNQGLDLKHLKNLTHESKKSLWVGVCDHLKEKGDRIAELRQHILELGERIHSGQPQDGDGDNLVVAQVALMNIIGAQLLQRTLQKDLDFQAKIHEEASHDAKAAVNQVSAAPQEIETHG